MPFSRPTLTELRDLAMGDITASDLPNADGMLRASRLRVMAWIMAAMAHGQYGYLDWIARQAIPFTCGDEYLEAWAALRGITRVPAAVATGSVTFSGTPTTLIPSGTVMTRLDGYAYRSTANATIGGGGSVAVPVQAWSTATGTTLAGSAGNATVATVVTIANAISGVVSAGAVSTAITGGSEAEDDDSLRTRMLTAFSSPAHGGSAADYVAWAREVAGVTRAWCNRNGVGPGTVVVYMMLDSVRSGFNGFPQGSNGVATDEPRDPTKATGDQLLVVDHILEVQPVTALVYATAPIAQPLDFDIIGLTPDTSDVRTAISAALKDLLVRKGSPLADIPIAESDVDAAILSVPGIVSFSLGGTWPQTPDAGKLFTVGTVTYS